MQERDSCSGEGLGARRVVGVGAQVRSEKGEEHEDAREREEDEDAQMLTCVTMSHMRMLSDVSYDGRPILYRFSFVEMAVPYAEPRVRKERKEKKGKEWHYNPNSRIHLEKRALS
eukprot:1161832-Pelagomonas_calceolata.AAC.8